MQGETLEKGTNCDCLRSLALMLSGIVYFSLDEERMTVIWGPEVRQFNHSDLETIQLKYCFVRPQIMFKYLL